jgi:hypothetical protein
MYSYHDKYKKYKNKYLNLKKQMSNYDKLNIKNLSRVDQDNLDESKKISSYDAYARYGISNPELVNSHFYKFMIQHPDYSAYDGKKKFNLELTERTIYSFQRFMQSSIVLSDGRKIYVGGEHEDGYDPDFFIYNDIVVIDGKNINIYLYPPEIFPPIENAKLEEKNGKLIIKDGTRYRTDYTSMNNTKKYVSIVNDKNYILDLNTFKIHSD